MICGDELEVPNQKREPTAHLTIDKKGIPLKTPRQVIWDNRHSLTTILKTLFLEDSPTIPVSDLNKDHPRHKEQKHLPNVEVNHDSSRRLSKRRSCYFLLRG
jgi:hypothetical protein